MTQGQPNGIQLDVHFPYKYMEEVLPGTQRLTLEGDLSVKMLDGAHRFIEEKIFNSVHDRAKMWHRDLSSFSAYEKSIESNRQRFMSFIGVQDKTKPPHNYSMGPEAENQKILMQRIAVNEDALIVAETAKYKVYQVRWTVLNDVYGEGLLLEPKSRPLANGAISRTCPGHSC